MTTPEEKVKALAESSELLAELMKAQEDARQVRQEMSLGEMRRDIADLQKVLHDQGERLDKVVSTLQSVVARLDTEEKIAIKLAPRPTGLSQTAMIVGIISAGVAVVGSIVTGIVYLIRNLK